MRLTSLSKCLSCTILRLANDGADTYVLVEEVDASITLWVQHAVEVEDVVVDTVLLQVKVLDGGETHDLCSFFKLGRVNLDTLLNLSTIATLGLLLRLASHTLLELSLGSCLCLV